MAALGQSPRDGRDETFQFADFECVAHFDGACEPVNPGGHGGWGYVIRAVDGGRLGAEIAAGSGYIPAGRQTTNNVAEYTAALEAIRAWLRLDRTTTLLVCGDSKLVIMQMRGLWQVKQGAYVKVYRELRALVDSHALAVKWQWVPRDQNARADELSKVELVKRGIPIAYRH